jgi:hypothetical protein
MGPLRELLARPDSIRITTPVLPRETLQRVLDTLRSDVAADQVRVDTPTQNLESYFLSVVEKARASEAETSGATSGSRVAAYLRGEAEVTAQAEKVLERLTLPHAAPAPQVTTPAAEPVDHRKLEALTQPKPVAGSAAIAVEATPQPADLAKADEKLASLLGKPK